MAAAAAPVATGAVKNAQQASSQLISGAGSAWEAAAGVEQQREMFGAPSTQPQARGLIGSRRSRWGHHGRQERFSTLGKRGAEEVITALLPHQVVDKTPNAKDLKHAKDRSSMSQLCFQPTLRT